MLSGIVRRMMEMERARCCDTVGTIVIPRVSLSVTALIHFPVSLMPEVPALDFLG